MEGTSRKEHDGTFRFQEVPKEGELATIMIPWALASDAKENVDERGETNASVESDGHRSIFPSYVERGSIATKTTKDLDLEDGPFRTFVGL